MADKRVLLIVGGGVAAYKALETARLLIREGVDVRPLLTPGGAQFITPLSLSAICRNRVHQDLFSLTEEAEMGHIELSRSADLIAVAPATANLMANAAQGLAPDLATTTLLATDKPVLMAPAMNVRMWNHPATQRNLATLVADGVRIVGPEEGEMACGEFGPGRLAAPEAIVAAILDMLAVKPRILTGRRVLVTAGPTQEPIDPVRYIANRSSGKQGFAIAAALADLGAEVILVTGPVESVTPAGVSRINVTTACEMLAACRSQTALDAAVMVAAVADWRPAGVATEKIKKGSGTEPQQLELVQNPDLLAILAAPGPDRPRLVVGFAAETDHVLEHARAKLTRKGCDWIVANDVSGDVMGGDQNTVSIVTADGVDTWPRAPKTEVAKRLARQIADALTTP